MSSRKRRERNVKFNMGAAAPFDGSLYESMPRTFIVDGGEITITPIAEHVRSYPRGKHYAQRDRYDTIMTLVYCGDDECFIEGLHGRFDRRPRALVTQYLKDAGYKLVRYECGGKSYVCDLLSHAAIRRLNAGAT